MGTPPDQEALRFYRVAYQRLEDASLILEKADRRNAAIYLAGYAVECMLKCMMLMETPANQRPVLFRSFRGNRGHDLAFLRDQLVQKTAKIPGRIERDIAFVSSWSTDMRYEPSSRSYDEADRFIQATRHILAWANERL